MRDVVCNVWSLTCRADCRELEPQTGRGGVGLASREPRPDWCSLSAVDRSSTDGARCAACEPLGRAGREDDVASPGWHSTRPGGVEHSLSGPQRQRHQTTLCCVTMLSRAVLCLSSLLLQTPAAHMHIYQTLISPLLSSPSNTHHRQPCASRAHHHYHWQDVPTTAAASGT